VSLLILIVTALLCLATWALLEVNLLCAAAGERGYGCFQADPDGCVEGVTGAGSRGARISGLVRR